MNKQAVAASWRTAPGTRQAPSHVTAASTLVPTALPAERLVPAPARAAAGPTPSGSSAL
jgi:hypothetical protein